MDAPQIKPSSYTPRNLKVKNQQFHKESKINDS